MELAAPFTFPVDVNHQNFAATKKTAITIPPIYPPTVKEVF